MIRPRSASESRSEAYGSLPADAGPRSHRSRFPDRKDGHPRILVIRRRYLGDTVLMQPFLANLRAHWPDAWLALALDTPYVDALASCSALDETIEVPSGLGVGASLKRWGSALLSVARRGPWDMAFDLARNERALALLLASRARRRVTLAIDGPPPRERLYTDVVRTTRRRVDEAHIVDVHNRLLEALEVPTPLRVPALTVPEGGSRAAEDLLRRASALPTDGRPLVLVHPGSGSDARRWPPDEFALVADRLVEEVGAQVVVLGGPAEPGLARSVLDAMNRPAALLTERTAIPTLFGLLSRADLLLCNDSGPMHMAAAVGTPVCALFGSQSAVTWAPLGDAGHLTFQPALPCGSSCVAPGVCDPGDPMKSFCVRRVPAERVADAAVGRLARLPRAGDGERDRVTTAR